MIRIPFKTLAKWGGVATVVTAVSAAVYARILDGSLLPFEVAGDVLHAERLVWADGAGGHGGVSGLERDADGRLIAVTDDGVLFWSDIRRDQAGRISGLPVHWKAEMPSELDRVEPEQRDAEDIALVEDGSLLISWEGDARITHQQQPVWFQTSLHQPDRFRMIRGNSGFEALAYLGNDALIAIPERKPVFEKLLLLPEQVDLSRDEIPLLRLSRQASSRPYWDVRYQGKIGLRNDWRVTGADWEDGKLWLVESQTTLAGFRTRVCVFPGIADQTTASAQLFEIAAGRFGNAEGIDVEVSDGQISVLLAADNDHSLLRKTVLAEVTLAYSGLESLSALMALSPCE